MKSSNKILAYHEISEKNNDEIGHYSMTPMYNVDKDDFEMQMRNFHESGFKQIDIDKLSKKIHVAKIFLITFDDGLRGNYFNAYPILKKYGFQATFFIATDSIGTSRFMNWEQIKEMSEQGMSIQSHTKSHRSLELLSERDIYTELNESKKEIERITNKEVNSISFPHGSYNKKIVKIAKEAGYKYLFTSEIENPLFNLKVGEENVFGRIMVTNGMGVGKIEKMLCGDTLVMTKLFLSKKTKNMVKKTIGINNYRRIYRKIFNIVK